MKLEHMKQWMKEQGVTENVDEFVSCFTQEKLDSFGSCPVVAVACMWEGWKLAKGFEDEFQSEGNKITPLKGLLKMGDIAYLYADLEVDGYPFDSYGFHVGDEVTILGLSFNKGKTMYDVALSRDKRRKIRVSEEELGVKNA